MAYTVVWSPAALEDVDSIAEFIARDSLFYAKAVVDRLVGSAGRLKDFPFSGRTVPELEDENIRELLIHSYRLIYSVKVEKVTILAVIHGKRLLDPLFERINCS